jgi:hypothetical protein
MERELVARNVLMCGLSHGREHVMNTFGDDLAPMIFTAFAELHRKNIIRDAFVFLIIRMFHRKYPSVDHDYILNRELTCDDILQYLQFTPDYKKEEHRLSRISEGERTTVINDFVQILSRQFLIQPEAFDEIVRRLEY